LNKAADICKRNELWSLIKKVSHYYGGDDSEWLKEYAKEMLNGYSLDDALTCFRDLASQYASVPKTKETVHQAGVEPPKKYNLMRKMYD
jgi:hypothetical protein